MGKAEKSIEIRAPPEKVWEMLAFDRIPEWEETYSHHVRVEYTSEVHTPEDKYRVGASAQYTLKRGELDLEITESRENEKITYRVKGVWNGFVTYILEPVDEGTKFTWVEDYEMPLGVLGKFIDKLYYKRMAEKSYEKSLENLKNILEQ